MPNFLLNMPPDQLTAVRAASQQMGVSVSQFIRCSIDTALYGGNLCGIVLSGQIVSGCVLLIRGYR